MADKKPTKRSAASSGDRPLRRRPATPDKDARKTSAPRKPSSDKSGFGKRDVKKPFGAKSGKPRAEAERPSRPVPTRPRKAAAPPEPARESAFEGERIAKAMARAGVCSRRDAENWIAQGRVAVNGRVLTSPAFNVREDDKIAIDGDPMQQRERTRLFLFHKPAGYVTTTHDPEGRDTVFAYLEERRPDLPRLMSVGRLDINTEGLLLLTNDGGLARTLELPATGWTRRYRVRVHGEVDQARLDELRKGVTIDGVIYAPIEATLERVQGANAWIAMSLTEGKNREIKRVMEHLKLDVTRLIRVSYGPFQLGELAEGSVEEVRLKVLREQLGKSLAELAGVDFSSPLREASPTEKQELRERAEKRARKHVSVLRKQREEKSERGPRARIERGATADRRGRAVVVERVAAPRGAGASASATRNARRFEAMRGEGRKPKRETMRGEAPAHGETRQRGERFARDEGRRHDDRRAPDSRRAPHFEQQRGERPARAPRERGVEKREGRPRDARRFERRPDDRPGASGRSEEARNDRKRENETRFERRPPRRDGDETRRVSRAQPRGGRGVFATESEAGARKAQRPLSGGAARKGPPKSAGKGPGRGGEPRGAPRKGPPSGPRKPRGA